MSRIIIAVVLFGFLAVASASAIKKQSTTAEPWLGQWVSTNRTENAKALLAALDAPAEFNSVFEVRHRFSKDGDLYHHEMDIVSKKIKKNVDFRLGQETQATLPSGQIVKRKHLELGNALVIKTEFVGKAKRIVDTYEVIGDELVKTCHVNGTVEGKRYFTRA